MSGCRQNQEQKRCANGNVHVHRRYIALILPHVDTPAATLHHGWQAAWGLT